MALGHEATGIVEALGSEGDTHLRSATASSSPSFRHAGSACAAKGGEPYMCAAGAAANGEGRLLNGGRRLHDDCGNDVHHHLGVSAFATHVVVDRRSAVKVDRDIPAHIAALFGCAVLTGAGAVMNSAPRVRPGETVLIYGLGGVGLAALLAARASGAGLIVAVDPLPDKRAIARESGRGGVGRRRRRGGCPRSFRRAERTW